MTTDIVSQFFDAVFPGGDHANVFCTTFPAGKKPATFGKRPNQLSRNEKNPIPCTHYFCVSTLKPDDEGLLRRVDENFDALHVVLLDDIKTSWELYVNLPDPTYIVETSPGNTQFGYVLSEPVTDSDLAKRIVHSVVGHYQGEEGADQAGKLITKLARPPSGWNLKEKYGDGFKIGLCDDVLNPEVKYTWEELLKAHGCELLSLSECGGGTRTTRPIKTGTERAADTEYRDWVLEAMADKGLVVEDKGGPWVTVTCPQAGQHTGGDSTAAYAPFGRGDRPGSRGFKCQHEHCLDFKSRQFFDWLREEHGIEANFSAEHELLEQRYAWVENGSRVVDLHAGPTAKHPVVAWQDFRTTWARTEPVYWQKADGDWVVKPLPLQKLWVESPRRVTYKGFHYQPGGAPDISHEEGTLYNLWRKPQHPEPTGSPDWFLEHIRYLFPDQEEGELFLDWIAYKLQRPEKRSYGFVMFTPSFGIGRSFVTDVLEAVWQQGVRRVELDNLTGKGSQSAYNEWLDSTQLVVIEEIKDGASDYREESSAYERIKQVVDTKVLKGKRVANKYGAIDYVDVYCNLLLVTNHHDAIKLPGEDDRRFYVAQNPVDRRSTETYAKLWNTLADPQAVANVFHYLMNREVTRDLVHPPITEAKRTMAAVSKSYLDEMWDDMQEKLGGDLVILPQLLKLGERWAIDNSYEEKITSIKGYVRRKYSGLPSLVPGDKSRSRVYDKAKKGQITPHILKDVTRWQTNASDRHHEANNIFVAQVIDELNKNDAKATLHGLPKLK